MKDKTYCESKLAAKLIAVLVGSKKHLELIRAGYRVHHMDGRIAWMQGPIKQNQGRK
jgi:hypothetical protein